MKFNLYEDDGELLGTIDISERDFYKVRLLAESRGEDVQTVLLELLVENLGGVEDEHGN